MKRIQYLFSRYFHDVLIAVEAILANKMKSFLTALGIMFGVAAVISMLAIGRGAQEEVLEQIKLVGVNNIIVTPTQLSVDAQGSGGAESSGAGANTTRFSPGLTLLDAVSIAETIPTVHKVSPVISLNYHAVLGGKSYPVVLEGVSPDYFELLNVTLAQGKIFNPDQAEGGFPVCVIGDNIRNRFFNTRDPLGEYIKAGETWLQVIGVVERRDFTASASDELGISSTDNKIFVPVKTMLRRFRDRAKINPEVLEAAARGASANNNQSSSSAGSTQETTTNQLDKIIVQVEETEMLSASADVIKRMLLRRHSNIYDFEVTVPELLLKQQQKTNDIFNIVLGAIASISLIVGGIGIMNIMLASVWERIREIGTRQAIGASRKDIVVQFLSESTLISVSGGMIGIFLGVVLAHIIHVAADIKTIVTLFSVLIAFGVSATVGIVFGYLPAKRAASQDPVESLRH